MQTIVCKNRMVAYLVAMSIYHLSIKTFKRSGGQSATAAAAYRSGERIQDKRTGQEHDYRKKGGIESSEIVLPRNAPEWAKDREQLWNQAELSERRKNAVVAREFEVALPSELTKEQRRELAVSFAKELVARHGFAADVSIHQPSRGGDQRNHHAHILVTTRRLGPEGFTEKTRELDERINRGPREFEHWRERFAKLTNEALEKNQHRERVDHRTLKAQGIDREPTQHRGPSATAIERKTHQPSRIHQEQTQEQFARAAQRQQEREHQERAREAAQRQESARKAAEREQAQKLAQERAATERERAAKAREELLARAREATEKRRIEQEQKAAPKPPEPSRIPPRSAWRGPTTKPAEKIPAPLEAIERAKELERQQREPEKAAEREPTQKTREELLAQAREATAKRRQVLEAAAKAPTPAQQVQAPATLVPAPAKAKEQSIPAPSTPEAQPLDVAAGIAAARERFAQMKAEQERIKAEQERAQKQQEQEQKNKNRGRDGPER